MPATNPLRSGTCASTLLPRKTSAVPRSSTIASARSRPKKSIHRRDAGVDRRPAPAPWPGRCRAPGCRPRRSSEACSRRSMRPRRPRLCSSSGQLSMIASSARGEVGQRARATPTRSTGTRRRRGSPDRRSRGSGPGQQSAQMTNVRSALSSGSSSWSARSRRSASGVVPNAMIASQRVGPARSALGLVVCDHAVAPTRVQRRSESEFDRSRSTP